MRIAKTNNKITTTNGSFTIGREIADGGEGVVYEIKQHSDWLVKIYKNTKREKTEEYADLEKKIEKFEECFQVLQGLFPEVCWPMFAVYYQGEFQGFITKKAQGKTLTRWLKERRDARNRDDIPIQRIAKKIADVIKRLHNIGKKNTILIGDLQPQNILIDSRMNISIIDSDSFQMGELTCPVQFPTYVSPERLLYPSIKDTHTPDEENYVLAYLFFQMMMYGLVHPYNYIGGPDAHEDLVKEGYFPYVCDNGKYINPGLYQRWLEFSPEIQAAFKKAFFDSHPARNPTGQIRRPTPEEWIECFEKSIKRGPRRNMATATPSTITIKKIPPKPTTVAPIISSPQPQTQSKGCLVWIVIITAATTLLMYL